MQFEIVLRHRRHLRNNNANKYSGGGGVATERAANGDDGFVLLCSAAVALATQNG